jgi:hypothetical protein
MIPPGLSFNERSLRNALPIRHPTASFTPLAPRTYTQLLRALQSLLGQAAVLHRPEELLLYEYDGSVEIAGPTCRFFRAPPRIVQLANQYQTPLIGRDAGTGLSGGALALLLDPKLAGRPEGTRSP